MSEIGELVGKTLTAIERNGDEELRFIVGDEAWRMYHAQNCCECVEIAEIIGDLNDLVNDGPILIAEQVSSEGAPPPEYPDSYTWTFYKLRTLNGDVTIRWLGESNGYYSEEVDFEKVKS